MLDLETYATTPDACVMTIGAIVFDMSGKEITHFYRRIDGASCDALGLRRDEKTLEFWKNQDPRFRFELETPENRVSIKDAIIDFTKFWNENNCNILWCNGANFDEPILSMVYYKLNMEKPWRFFNVRCARTLYSLAKINHGDMGPATHHALQDCSRQIRGVTMSMSILLSRAFL